MKMLVSFFKYLNLYAGKIWQWKKKDKARRLGYYLQFRPRNIVRQLLVPFSFIARALVEGTVLFGL